MQTYHHTHTHTPTHTHAKCRLQSSSASKCPHGSAPSYLVDELCQVADVKARQRLRSSSSSSLIVSRTRLSTVGDRAFPVAAAPVWNSLPQHVTSGPSEAVFRLSLKTYLFHISYPAPLWSYNTCAVTPVASDTIIIFVYLLTYLPLATWILHVITNHTPSSPMNKWLVQYTASGKNVVWTRTRPWPRRVRPRTRPNKFCEAENEELKNSDISGQCFKPGPKTWLSDPAYS